MCLKSEFLVPGMFGQANEKTSNMNNQLENLFRNSNMRTQFTLRVFSDTSLIKAFNSSVTPLNGKKVLSFGPSAP